MREELCCPRAFIGASAGDDGPRDVRPLQKNVGCLLMVPWAAWWAEEAKGSCAAKVASGTVCQPDAATLQTSCALRPCGEATPRRGPDPPLDPQLPGRLPGRHRGHLPVASPRQLPRTILRRLLRAGCPRGEIALLGPKRLAWPGQDIQRELHLDAHLRDDLRQPAVLRRQLDEFDGQLLPLPDVVAACGPRAASARPGRAAGTPGKDGVPGNM